MCGCWGACVVAGGMRGCSGGACMVAPGGACMVAPGGHAWLLPRGHVWDMMRYRDMINEQVVRILLECILVSRVNISLVSTSLANSSWRIH